MAKKLLALRRPDICAVCGAALAVGERAVWDTGARTTSCLACESGPTDSANDAGVAGASALREHERRAIRERGRQDRAVADDAAWRTKVKDEHPVLGRVASALTARPVVRETQSTKAWATGGAGEQTIGKILADCSGIVPLHDRRVPGHGKANIDHIVVSPSGVHVVDTKRYGGAIELRDKGSFFRRDDRLYVGGRDRTSLVAAMAGQVRAVRTALSSQADPTQVAVLPVLCFVEGEFPLLRRKPYEVQGVLILWPRALQTLVEVPGPLSARQVQEVASALARALPSAG